MQKNRRSISCIQDHRVSAGQTAPGYVSSWIYAEFLIVQSRSKISWAAFKASGSHGSGSIKLSIARFDLRLEQPTKGISVIVESFWLTLQFSSIRATTFSMVSPNKCRSFIQKNLCCHVLMSSFWRRGASEINDLLYVSPDMYPRSTPT